MKQSPFNNYNPPMYDHNLIVLSREQKLLLHYLNMCREAGETDSHTLITEALIAVAESILTQYPTNRIYYAPSDYADARAFLDIFQSRGKLLDHTLTLTEPPDANGDWPF